MPGLRGIGDAACQWSVAWGVCGLLVVLLLHGNPDRGVEDDLQGHRAATTKGLGLAVQSSRPNRLLLALSPLRTHSCFASHWPFVTLCAFIIFTRPTRGNCGDGQAVRGSCARFLHGAPVELLGDYLPLARGSLTNVVFLGSALMTSQTDLFSLRALALKRQSLQHLWEYAG